MTLQNERVLIIMDGLYIGGTETHVLAIAKEMIKQGVHVVIVGKTGPLHRSFLSLGCPIYPIECKVEGSVSSDIWEETKNILREIMKWEKITVVHGHQTTSARFAFPVARELGIPFVFTVHGTYESLENLPDIAENGGTIISVSQPIQHWLMQQNISSTLIPNGINLKQYRPLQKTNLLKKMRIPLHAPVVLYAARLSWEKAKICKQVIQACCYLRKRYFPSLHLIIAGKGFHDGEIKKMIEKVQGKSKYKFIHFLGEYTMMSSLYSISNCVVGTGRVALEAMACSRLVVSAGRHGFFGTLYPNNLQQAWYYYFGDHNSIQPCTSSLLAKNIKTVLSTSKRQRLIWGRQNRLFIKENFGIEQVTKTLLNTYASLIPPSP
ncbi:glycosyltransferase family 4 protein [Aneurinibacillus thermoaerophilus]|uniref:Glycosyltransferase family 4 protein n=1 Tax=Aneurinibacillus thermoaerophilus TaxID=143495 RepID=A0ABX8Y6Y7_ANETH|nr:glycosyltransferase family 4 protein [Aneurinibacillus thermoaerophilus]QYY41242.1 glycosyltransferase family 4 protein [Aneurinibacillus thermoaerophilus]